MIKIFGTVVPSLGGSPWLWEPCQDGEERRAGQALVENSKTGNPPIVLADGTSSSGYPLLAFPWTHKLSKVWAEYLHWQLPVEEESSHMSAETPPHNPKIAVHYVLS